MPDYVIPNTVHTVGWYPNTKVTQKYCLIWGTETANHSCPVIPVLIAAGSIDFDILHPPCLLLFHVCCHFWSNKTVMYRDKVSCYNFPKDRQRSQKWEGNTGMQ